MKYYFWRIDKDGKSQVAECQLHISSNKEFQIRFSELTNWIGLNDGNFHCINSLTGVVTELIVDEGGINIRGFVNVKDNWFIDGFTLHFTNPETNPLYSNKVPPTPPSGRKALTF